MGDIASAPDLKKRDEVDPADALKGAVNVLQLPVQADQATAEPKGGKGTYAIKNTRGAIQEPEAQLVYIHTSEGELALTWKVETDIWTNWLLSYVDAHDPEKVHAVVDYSAAATYEV
jgi:extracellular elastinolytic metalloproteinase